MGLQGSTRWASKLTAVLDRWPQISRCRSLRAALGGTRELFASCMNPLPAAWLMKRTPPRWCVASARALEACAAWLLRVCGWLLRGAGLATQCVRINQGLLQTRLTTDPAWSRAAGRHTRASARHPSTHPSPVTKLSVQRCAHTTTTHTRLPAWRAQRTRATADHNRGQPLT